MVLTIGGLELATRYIVETALSKRSENDLLPSGLSLFLSLSFMLKPDQRSSIISEIQNHDSHELET